MLRSAVLIVILIVGGFLAQAQNKPCIANLRCSDLTIVVSKDTCSTPAPGVTVSIFRNDNESRHLQTDSLGRIHICECTDPGFFADGFEYLVKVEAPNSSYFLYDQFETRSPIRSARTVRSLSFKKSCIPLIDLTILFSKQDSEEPLAFRSGYVLRDDSVRVDFVTDSIGRFDITTKTHPGFVIPDHAYTIEIPATNKWRSGNSDGFNTHGITVNTRIVRDLRSITHYRLGTMVIQFAEADALLTDKALNEVEFWNFVLEENPTMTVALVGVYDTEKEMTLARKRAEIVKDKLIELGTNPQRLSVELIDRKQLIAANKEYPFQYNMEDVADVQLTILSFDFKE